MTVLLISGTSTDVGKTVVTAALAATFASAGARVAVCKPAQTGVSSAAPGTWRTSSALPVSVGFSSSRAIQIHLHRTSPLAGRRYPNSFSTTSLHRYAGSTQTSSLWRVPEGYTYDSATPSLCLT